MRDPQPILFVSVCCAALTAVLSSCSAGPPVRHETQAAAEEGILPTPYSVVCIIHGDGDYVYHDTDGNEFRADEELVGAAIRVAQSNPFAEVFIFHQKPRRRFLFLFPLHEGEFYYYRNGQLVANEPYWRDQGQPRFSGELEVYERFHANGQGEKANVFLYGGHEIPEAGGTGYDASLPDRAFTVRDLADGLQDFTRHSATFDLMVLSSCYGGTPYTIGTLGPFARHIIASPDNLHLSHFDLRSLERMEIGLGNGDMTGFARRFARRAFERLTEDIYTAVSVAVYDVDRVQEFLRSVHGRPDQAPPALTEGRTPTSRAAIEPCDCADIPAFAGPTMNEGVEVFYRPAHFGRSRYKLNHSGWECWRERRPPAIDPVPE